MAAIDTGGGDRMALAVLAQHRMATTEQMHLMIAPGVRIEQTRRRMAKLIVWAEGRLAFERLQQRMHHRGAAAARAAGESPAHLVAFDLLRVNGQDLTGRPFADRYAVLEELFLEHALAAPWSLCPTTTDPEQAAAWLADYTAVGIEGLVFRPLASRYVPGGRGWTKCKMRQTTEAIVGAVTGSLAAPTTALLGRYDESGRFRYAGRTTTLNTTVRHTLAGQLRAAGAEQPWTGRTFSAGWGSREHLSVGLVVPEAVAEVAVDVARDSAGRWRHPTRLTRIRTDMTPGDVPLFGTAP